MGPKRTTASRFRFLSLKMYYFQGVKPESCSLRPGHEVGVVLTCSVCRQAGVRFLVSESRLVYNERAMRAEDLQAVIHIGQALWADPARSSECAEDALTAASALFVNPGARGRGDSSVEGSITERAGTALYRRAGRDGLRATAPGVGNPFYRLAVEERLVLSALHVGHWSYERIGRILGRTPIQVQELAWSARLYLLTTPGRPISAPHPTGSARAGLNCPDYNPRSPWTQAFLDEELSKQQKLFIQDHLQTCPVCTQALSSARSFYYAVDAQIPRSQYATSSTARLSKILRVGVVQRDPAQMSVSEALLTYFARTEIRIFIVISTGLLIWLSRR